jgi:uncharacterized protein involved in tolerance to divalent cations
MVDKKVNTCVSIIKVKQLHWWNGMGEGRKEKIISMLLL